MVLSWSRASEFIDMIGFVALSYIDIDDEDIASLANESLKSFVSSLVIFNMSSV
jgi:hypothetical protein